MQEKRKPLRNLHYRLLSFGLVLLLFAFFTGCEPHGEEIFPEDGKKEQQAKDNTTAENAPKQETEKEYEIILSSEEAFSEYLVIPDATEVETTDIGVSYVSPLSFGATVEYFEDLIDEFYIEGQPDEIDIEDLGIDQGWKYDGAHDGKIFTVTVAQSKAGQIGVAIIYQ